MNSSLFICADNRQISGKDFDEESSLASYQRLLRATVSRLDVLHDLHSKWLNTPTAIFVPNNANQNCAQLVTKNTLMNDGMICQSSDFTSVNMFWKEFLADCLFKIKQATINNKTKIYIIIISSNLGLLGNYSMDNNKNIEEIVKRFAISALELASACDDFTIHFVCPIVSAAPGLSMCNIVDDVGCTYLQMELSTQMKEKCIFQPIINTSIYYEEEVRLIMSNISPIVHSHLPFPDDNGQHCSLLIDLIPSSLDAADLIHEGMQFPVLHSMCSKGKFNPLFFDGHAFTMIPTVQSDKASDNQNRLIFANLSKLLAKDSSMLVLKIPYLSKCSQYWAIIPPTVAGAATDISYYQLILVKLVDKDSLLRCNDKEIIEEDIKATSDQMDANDDENDEIIEYLQNSLQGMAFHEYNPRSSFSGYVNYMMSNPTPKPTVTSEPIVNVNTSTNAHASKIPSRRPPLPSSSSSSSSSALSAPGQLTLAKSSSSSTAKASSSSSSASSNRLKSPPQPQVHKAPPQPQVHRAVDLQKQNTTAGRSRDSQRTIRGGGRGSSVASTSIAKKAISSVTYDDDDELMDF